MSRESQIRIAVFPPDSAPFMATVENTLESLQKIVGGCIEVFQTSVSGIVGVCLDDFYGHEFNAAATAFRAFIQGTFFLCTETDGPEGTEFSGLSDAQEFWIRLCPFWPDSPLEDDQSDLDLDGDPWS